MGANRRRRSLRVLIVCVAFMLPQFIGVMPALAASEWNLVASHCFPFKYSDDGTWIHACWLKHKLTNDGSGTKDYFQLTFYAGGGEWTGFSELHGMSLAVIPNATPSQAWVDWDPKVDWSGGSCSNYNVGISYGAASFSYNVERCPEQWDSTHYPTPGKHLVSWWNLGGTKQDRELGLGVIVKVNQGTTPGWTFGYGST